MRSYVPSWLMILFVGTWGTTIGLLLLYLMAQFFLPDPIEYLSLDNAPVIQVRSPTTTANALEMDLVLCNRDKTPLLLTTEVRELIDAKGTRTPLPQVKLTVAPGCFPLHSKIRALPVDTPPGTYYLSGVSTATGSWHMLWKHTRISWETSPFEVQ